jgi:DNA-directed RNA polymerase subunit beta
MKNISFGKIKILMDPPFLLKMQIDSFAEFLQLNVLPEKRKQCGLERVFRDVFPISNNDNSIVIEYVSYCFGKSKYSIEESMIRNVTYSFPLNVKLRLTHKIYDTLGKEKLKISEQEVYFGDMPIMTNTATFVINGAERVVVSQIHRSPGVIFEEDEDKKISILGKSLYRAIIIPYRGTWLEFEFDHNGVLYVRIDRKKKILLSTFLRAIGFEEDEKILELFKDSEELSLKEIMLDKFSNVNKFIAENVYDLITGEMLATIGDELNYELVKKLQNNGFDKISIFKDISMILTIKKDTTKNKKEAVNYIYKILRTQEFVIQEKVQEFIENLFFKLVRKYDLTTVGRYKIHKKFKLFFDYYKDNFGFDLPTFERRTLSKIDIIVTIKYLLLLYNGESNFSYKNKITKLNLDDIDHLGNRRVRAVGELLENQTRIGLIQTARITKEKLNNQEKLLDISPKSVISIVQFSSQIKKFFGTSRLSQFMDQINPLSELTHKRRLSALGPGGLNRKRAGFEVRDVHHTHYGRICPIETPEGPNIGLITSLSTFARINPYGLIETPYQKIENAKTTEKIEYLTADKEDEFFVAQANTPIDQKGNILPDLVQGRKWSDFLFQPPNKVDYMDISPMQVISVSAALIPFLEHDDANRALMGCNMQRQSVPLMITESPMVSTGIENKVAIDSGVVVTARMDGKVVSISSDEIMIYSSKYKKIEIYKLKKYLRSNQDTCINQKALVVLGDFVKKNQIIADGPATNEGQLALGQNILVAYMPWDGYNFEDAMLLSEKLVREDKFTSIHIKEFQIEARETRGQPEEITKDIPNVGSEDLLNLDENGIIKIGSMVQRGDILVGKTIPKVEHQITPEERLLRVLFGKKSEEVQDASLRVPPGVSGKVISVRTFVRFEKLTVEEKKDELDKLYNSYVSVKNILKKNKIKRLKKVANLEEKEEIEAIYTTKEKILSKNYELEKERFNNARDDLPVSVNKIVKVYIASKLRVQVGDKLAGRHGNKGIVAKILPIEDMPRLPDGTPVDCVLSPLSIPSRMNVGQLLEAMLGWAGQELKIQMVTPVFDGANEMQIKNYINIARELKLKNKKTELLNFGLTGKELEDALSKFTVSNLPTDDCKITLFDGRTGEPFMEKVTIGVMYIMKLNHLVEDKMHARSTGPYSLITRQPLGGKAQFGGQRFGEMEVWAVEGYGAAHVLQEFLTVKSDDVDGRVKMYDSIIKGESISKPGTPESFKVLINELRSLGLNIELVKKDKLIKKYK